MQINKKMYKGGHNLMKWFWNTLAVLPIVIFCMFLSYTQKNLQLAIFGFALLLFIIFMDILISQKIKNPNSTG